jgi:hypothetical protein
MQNNISTLSEEYSSSDTFNPPSSSLITSEPLDFEAFYYTMLNDYKDRLLTSDPLGSKKPWGPHVLMLYNRDNRRLDSVCIHLDSKAGGKGEKDLIPYILEIISQEKPDYYVSFNTYKRLTDEKIKVINELKQMSKRFEKKGYCCYEHLPPEPKREVTDLANKFEKMIDLDYLEVVGKDCSSIKEIIKTYEIIWEKPGDEPSKVLDLHEMIPPPRFSPSMASSNKIDR